MDTQAAVVPAAADAQSDVSPLAQGSTALAPEICTNSGNAQESLAELTRKQVVDQSGLSALFLTCLKSIDCMQGSRSGTALSSNNMTHL